MVSNLPAKLFSDGIKNNQQNMWNNILDTRMVRCLDEQYKPGITANPNDRLNCHLVENNMGIKNIQQLHAPREMKTHFIYKLKFTFSEIEKKYMNEEQIHIYYNTKE